MVGIGGNMITNTSKRVVLVDALPGMIEASEVRGQRELVKSTLLPSNMNRQRELFERMGFKFGEVVKDDPLFIHAELPPGWKKHGTDHAMWSEIVDERGAKRVGVFYKAAFYDRDAFMRLNGRYKIDAPWDADDYQTVATATAKVVDLKTGNLLHEAEGNRDVTRDGGPAVSDAEDKARAWCKENLPSDEIAAWFND